MTPGENIIETGGKSQTGSEENRRRTRRSKLEGGEIKKINRNAKYKTVTLSLNRSDRSGQGEVIGKFHECSDTTNIREVWVDGED